MKIAYVFLNGIASEEDIKFYRKFITKNKGDIFCADGGTNLCFKLNLIPNEIWGDLDSISKEILCFYKEKNIKIKKFSSDKDNTDAELILKEIKNKSYERIYLLGALGGAIEHELTNVNLLFKYQNLYILNKNEKIFPIKEREKFLFKNSQNKKISFIIFSDEIKNISLKGFKYNLDEENFKRGDTRLISNLIVENLATIKFYKGKILCILKIF